MTPALNFNCLLFVWTLRKSMGIHCTSTLCTTSVMICPLSAVPLRRNSSIARLLFRTDSTRMQAMCSPLCIDEGPRMRFSLPARLLSQATGRQSEHSAHRLEFGFSKSNLVFSRLWSARGPGGQAASQSGRMTKLAWLKIFRKRLRVSCEYKNSRNGRNNETRQTNTSDCPAPRRRDAAHKSR